MNQQLRDKVVGDIEKSGHSMIGVFSDDAPPFTYTIGLTGKHGFEIILIGARTEHAGVILNAVAASLDKGFVIEEGKVYGSEDPDNTWVSAACRFMKCDHPELFTDYAVQAALYYEHQMPVYQMVVPDAQGFFPEEDEFDHDYMDHRQPLLYRNQLREAS